MDKRHREIINKSMQDIINNTDIEVLLPKLELKKVFPQILIDRYKACPSEDKRTRLVFEDIQKRGPDAFKQLLESCRSTGHIKLYGILTKTLEPEYPTTTDCDGQNCTKGNDENDIDNRTSGIKPYFFPDFNENQVLERTLENSASTTVLNLNVKTKVIKVKPATEFLDIPNNSKHKLPPYPMRGKLRGVVLIINNKEFDMNMHKPRKGADIDEQCLIELFNQLNFHIYVSENLTAVDMKKRLQTFTKDPILVKADSCFVIVMSHGEAGSSVDSTNIVTFDNGLFSSHDIISFFNNADCPALQQKPKVFLFQTCRGNLSDPGTPLVTPFSSRIETDGGSVNIKDLEPFMSNACICYSSYPGYESYRHRDTGSWFIEQLCEVFMNHAHDTDVQEMLKIMAHEVKELETENQRKQTPEIRDVLFRPCYLNPGLIKSDEVSA